MVSRYIDFDFEIVDPNNGTKIFNLRIDYEASIRRPLWYPTLDDFVVKSLTITGTDTSYFTGQLKINGKVLPYMFLFKPKKKNPCEKIPLFWRVIEKTLRYIHERIFFTGGCKK